MRANTWGRVAMDAFTLENWVPCSEGFCVVASVLDCDESGCSTLRSLVKGLSFQVQFAGDTPEPGDEVSLLNFALSWDGTSYQAMQLDDSIWFTRASDPLTGVFKVRELCAGLGAMGTGASSLGFSVVSAVEIQRVTCEAYTRNSPAPIVHGDLTDPKIVGKMWLQVPGPAGLLSGFSCQPFSAFGDQKAQHDTRSSSLPGTLRAAHWLQAPFLLLECVCPAGEDE